MSKRPLKWLATFWRCFWLCALKGHGAGGDLRWAVHGARRAAWIAAGDSARAHPDYRRFRQMVRDGVRKRRSKRRGVRVS